MTERKRAIRPMHPRDPAEPHRAATALELLFDLVTVIAIAAAAEGLHHAIAEAHAGQGCCASRSPSSRSGGRG
ncbi:hypothetical protein ACFSTI_09975 [Rhizorhabdus histidinilytica]